MGVLDDAVETGGTANPTTRDQIVNLRRAKENNVWKSMTLNWTPLDNEKWYYLAYSTNSTEDTRFLYPCVFNYQFTGPSLDGFSVVDIDYVVEFAGAAVASLT